MFIFTFCLTDVEFITADNFMTKLDNGVIVCKLANVIDERYQTAACNNKNITNNPKRELNTTLEEVSKLYALFNSLMNLAP